jgi:hypothetical protein
VSRIRVAEGLLVDAEEELVERDLELEAARWKALLDDKLAGASAVSNITLLAHLSFASPLLSLSLPIVQSLCSSFLDCH